MTRPLASLLADAPARFGEILGGDGFGPCFVSGNDLRGGTGLGETRRGRQEQQEGKPGRGVTLEEMDGYWDEAKAKE